MALHPAPPKPIAVATLDALLADSARIAALPAETRVALAHRAVAGLEVLLPGLPGDVAGAVVGRVLGTILGCALTTATGQTITPAEPPGQTLTAIEVATRLRVPRPYVYELIRRGELPVVTVGPKYVRVPAQALAEWVARQTRTGLDTRVYHRYSSKRDGRRAATAPKDGRPDSDPGGRAARRDEHLGGPVGAGRAGDLRAHRPTDHTAARGRGSHADAP